MTSFLDHDGLFLHDALYGGAFYAGASAEVTTTSSLLPSDDLWNKFDMMLPTPPVSPSHGGSACSEHGLELPAAATASEDDLDLGLGDLGLDIPGFLDGCDADSDWLFEEIFGEALPAEAAAVGVVAGVQCDVVGELRHDCMWAGLCPAEEHRHKKELPMLLSTSPPDSTLTTPLCGPALRLERRARLDTLGSIRPETPLSLSDSEMDAEQLTSPDQSSDEGAKDAAASSSSDDASDAEDDLRLRRPRPESAALPPNIHPVRSHVRKMASSAKCSIKAASAASVLLPDHSYSHSDHSYHTQRRPDSSAALVADMLGIQTPSDSGLFCYYFLSLYLSLSLSLYPSVRPSVSVVLCNFKTCLFRPSRPALCICLSVCVGALFRLIDGPTLRRRRAWKVAVLIASI